MGLLNSHLLILKFIVPKKHRENSYIFLITRAGLTCFYNETNTFNHKNEVIIMSENNPQNIAVITGAGTGIGKDVAILLADLGFDVLAIGRNKENLLKTQLNNIEKIKILPADISTEEGRLAISSTLDKKTKIKFLVHNAATLGYVGNLTEMPPEEWRQALSLNVETPLFLTNLLLPYLDNSRVLFVSSGFAHIGVSGLGCYSITKATLYQLYACLKKEFEGKNLYFGSILPGIVDTPMQDALRKLSPKEFPEVERFKALKEKNKLLSSKTVADFICWILTKTDQKLFSEKEWDVKDWITNKYT